MRSFALAIETKDRRLTGGVNYLGETLRNLARAGVWDDERLSSLQIMLGGEQPDFVATEIFPNIPQDRMVAIIDSRGRTRQQNGAMAIRMAATDKNADFVIKLEDDLDFISDFLGSVDRWLGDKLNLVPMIALGGSAETVADSHYAPGESVLGEGTSFPIVRHALASGVKILGMPLTCFWGAQALLWKREVAEQLAEWFGPDPFYPGKDEEIRHCGHDLMFALWGQTLPVSAVGIAVPSFVQHIGRQSTINNVFFEFPWPGREWLYRGESQ